MKKIISVLFTSLIVLLMFVGTGNEVKAAEDENCICHDVTPVFGAERNKIVSDILKTDGFKNLKNNQELIGFEWYGANQIQVLKHNTLPLTMVGVPFTDKDGITKVATFFNGDLMGIVDPEDELF